MNSQITDFNITPSRYNYTNVPISVQINNSKDLLTLDYVKITKMTIDKIKQSNGHAVVLDKLNSIYDEHIKLVTLGKEYPIYTLHGFYNNNIDCILNGFSGIGDKVTVYKVPEFVTEIRVNDECSWNINKLIVNHKLELYRLGENKNIQVVGLENLSFLSNATLGCIDYTLTKENSKVLRLKYLDSNLPKNKKTHCVEELILENTCRIENLEVRTLRNITKLKKLTLCKSVQTIENIELKDCIRKTEDGKYYTKISNSDEEERILWINFNYEVDF